MKTIGLIGGMSWNSSMDYYRYVNEMVAERLGGLHSARVVMFSVDFAPIERAQHEDRWEDTVTTLGEAGEALRRAGADFVLICTNTMHKVADAVAQRATLPLLDIRDVTGTAIARRGFRAVGLLGTRFVMEDPFYRDRLRECFDIGTVVPGEEGKAAVHRIIFDELCRGIVTDASRSECLTIIDDLRRRGAEGIILGCTELPLLVRQDDVSVTLFDTTRLHAEAAVERALAG